MEEIRVCDNAKEIGAGCVVELTAVDGHSGLMNAERSKGVMQMKTINSLRVLSKDPDIIVVKERQFKCDVESCAQKFMSNASLLRHKKRCHSDSRPEATLESSAVSKSVSIACQVCSKVFSQQGNLKAHLRTHSSDLPFTCNFTGCHRCFNSSESLKRHKLSHLGIKLFACDICGRSCSSNLALKEHVARHVDLKPYRCDTCGRMFRQVSCYKRHLQTHNSQHRPFECDICHQAFSQTVYLKSHMKSHTGEKPFECGQCLKRFAHASDRKRHMSVHSDERKFACDLCGSRFTDPSSCRRHIHEHSIAKSNVCSVCDASFKRSFQLKHHMAKSHGVEVNTIPAINICKSLPASSSNRSLSSRAEREDAAKIRIVVDHCPFSSVLTEGAKMPAGNSRHVQCEVMMGNSRRVERVAVKASGPVKRVTKMTVGNSRVVQREMTTGISRPLVREAAVGISRHVLETENGVVSLLVYPMVHSQSATETDRHLVQEGEFREDQNNFCHQLKNPLLPATDEPNLHVNIIKRKENVHVAAISDVVSSRPNFDLAANVADSEKNFSDPENTTEGEYSCLNNSIAPTHSVIAPINIGRSEEINFTDYCLSKTTPSAHANVQVIRDVAKSLPLCDTLSPESVVKTDTMELLTLCHDYPADQNPGISPALLASEKGFADMTLPYDDVLKMLSASDSLDQLNCFENLHQDVCR